MEWVVAIDSDTSLGDKALSMLGAECELVHCDPGPVGTEAVRVAKVQVAAVGSRWRFDGVVLDQLPTLAGLARPGIGMDNIDLLAATQRGVAVFNTPNAPTVSTAELTVTLLLALAKRIRATKRLLDRGVSPWTDAAEPWLVQVRDKALGIVGLGRIGGEVARICRLGLGMKVIGYDPYISAERAHELGVSMCSTLGDLLGAADFVSLHVPLGKDTKGMINAATLSLMRSSAFLINCARGPIVDEGALIAALRAGRLAGAGMDVFEQEPPSPANPLLAMENVIATPHSAGYTWECAEAMGVGVAEQVLDLLRGVRPANLANPDVWDSPAMRRRLQAIS